MIRRPRRPEARGGGGGPAKTLLDAGGAPIPIGDLTNGQTLWVDGDGDLASTGIEPPDAVVFNADGANWQDWVAPDGHTMIFIEVIGAGSGGGGGRSGADGTDRRGGGGGGSGGIGIYCGPLLWSSLKILVGVGGDGGAANTNGSQGTRTYVSLAEDSGDANLILKSSQSMPSVGSAGGVGTGGGGGGGAVAPLAATEGARYGALGGARYTNGGAGSNGGSGSNGGAVTPPTHVPLTGGTGGGGTSNTDVESAGGTIQAAGLSAQVLGGLANGGNGNPGVASSDGEAHTGGTGGGGNAGGAGGDGGAGAVGCGGGGGGGVTGGTGGRGGDGRVRILSW